MSGVSIYQLNHSFNKMPLPKKKKKRKSYLIRERLDNSVCTCNTLLKLDNGIEKNCSQIAYDSLCASGRNNGDREHIPYSAETRKQESTYESLATLQLLCAFTLQFLIHSERSSFDRWLANAGCL